MLTETQLQIKWRKDTSNRWNDFNEFLMRTEGIIYNQWKLKVPSETEWFKDKDKMTSEEVKQLYVNNTTEIIGTLSHNSRIADVFLEQFKIPKDARILDFGAGVGQDLFEAEKKGYKNLFYYDVCKIEIGFVNFLIKKYNSKIKIIDKLDIDYDFIHAGDVIEHIPNYKEVWEDLFKRLKVGGIFINVPQFNKPGKNPRPTHYFENYPVIKLFEENGFEMIAGNIWRKK